MVGFGATEVSASSLIGVPAVPTTGPNIVTRPGISVTDSR